MTNGKAEARTRILVVDDERHTSRLLEFILQRAGYRTRVVGDGQRALEEAAKFDPDAMLLDLELPILTGEQVLSALRKDERFKDLPVVILTARAFDGEGNTLPEGTPTCSKPVTPSTLLTLLSSLGRPPTRDW